MANLLSVDVDPIAKLPKDFLNQKAQSPDSLRRSGLQYLCCLGRMAYATCRPSRMFLVPRIHE